MKSLVSVGSFSISSNIAAQTSTSTLRFIAEDAALFISNKANTRQKNFPVDLRKDYVCVLDMGLFELSLRLSDKSTFAPRIDLRASNNVLHIRTCADSGKALTELLTYFASDGDLTSMNDDAVNVNSVNESPSKFCNTEETILVNTKRSEIDDNQNNSQNLSKSQVEHVHDLMEEAMAENLSLASNGRTSKYFLYLII